MEQTTLKWFVEESPVQDLKFICCEELMTTPISGVSILENPDSVRWIHKNELVLSTGYIFMDKEDLQIKIIHDLKQSGCAALCIKINSYFDTIPERMVAAAKDKALPIIVIPYYHIFRDIISCINHRLETSELRTNTYIYNEVQNITELYFRKKSLSKILEYLSHYYNSPVIFTDHNFKVVDAFIPLACKELLPYKTADIFYIPETGLVDIVYNNDYYCFQIHGQKAIYFGMPIPNEKFYIFLQTRMRPINEIHRSILKMISPFLVIAAQKSSWERSKFGSEDYYSSFFSLLYSESTRDIRELQIICDLYSFNPELKRVCITIQLQDGYRYERKSSKLLLEQVQRFIGDDFHYFCCLRNNFISIFRFFPTNHQGLDAITESYMHAQLLFEELSKQFHIRIGVSRAYSGIHTISTCFEESFRSIEMQNKLHLPGQTSSYWEQSVYHMLNQPSMKHFSQLYCDIIQPLIDYDKKNGTNFLDTLRSFFQNTFNVSRTAEDLFIHRNTLNYRLHQIKELLRFDFDFDNNINALFSLYLAICCYDLFSSDQL